MVNWVGEGSAYPAGKEAHLPGCKYRLRDAESKYSLVNRWQHTGEVQRRLYAKALARQKRKRSKMEGAVEGAQDEMVDSQKQNTAKNTAKVDLPAM
jgi:hypothetical protein